MGNYCWTNMNFSIGNTCLEHLMSRNLTSMIRATSSRSSRPNPMKDQGDSHKVLRPAALRRLPRRSHSVAKQASFNIAFGADFQGFRKPKWTQKSMLGPIFFEVIFEYVFASIFGRFFEAPNLKNWAPASTGARFLQNGRFRKSGEKSSILASFSDA